MGEWFDVVGVDCLYLVDQVEDVVQGFGGVWKIGFVQVQVGEMGDFFYVGVFKCYWEFLVKVVLEGWWGVMCYIRQGMDVVVGGLILFGWVLWGWEKFVIQYIVCFV